MMSCKNNKSHILDFLKVEGNWGHGFPLLLRKPDCTERNRTPGVSKRLNYLLN